MADSVGTKAIIEQKEVTGTIINCTPFTKRLMVMAIPRNMVVLELGDWDAKIVLLHKHFFKTYSRSVMEEELLFFMHCFLHSDSFVVTVHPKYRLKDNGLFEPSY